MKNVKWENTKTVIALVIFVLIIIAIGLSLYPDTNEGRNDLQQIGTAIAEYSIGDVIKLVWNFPMSIILLTFLAWYLLWPRGLFRFKKESKND